VILTVVMELLIGIKLVINISNNLGLKIEQLTLLHEILHALELNTGIEKLSESQIEQFAHNLYFVIRNNPDLMEYLLK